MSSISGISEAIINGINILQDEVAEGKGSDIFLAGLNMKSAVRRGHEQAAIYWLEVLTACRKLENRPTGKITISATQDMGCRKLDA